MKRFATKITTAFLAFTFFVGQASANFACVGDYYQPEVPAELRK